MFLVLIQRTEKVLSASQQMRAILLLLCRSAYIIFSSFHLRFLAQNFYWPFKNLQHHLSHLTLFVLNDITDNQCSRRAKISFIIGNESSAAIFLFQKRRIKETDDIQTPFHYAIAYWVKRRTTYNAMGPKDRNGDKKWSLMVKLEAMNEQCADGV